MNAPSSPPTPVPTRDQTAEAPALPVEHRPPPAWRAPLIGALLIPPAALFGVYSYTIVQAIHWSQQSLKCGPIFLLFLLTVGNLGLGRVALRFALIHAELVYVIDLMITFNAIDG